MFFSSANTAFFVAATTILAYLDPGSGSIIIQLLIAALLGAGLLVRTQWAKIRRLLGRKEEDDSEDTDGE